MNCCITAMRGAKIWPRRSPARLAIAEGTVDAESGEDNQFWLHRIAGRRKWRRPAFSDADAAGAYPRCRAARCAGEAAKSQKRAQSARDHAFGLAGFAQQGAH